MQDDSRDLSRECRTRLVQHPIDAALRSHHPAAEAV